MKKYLLVISVFVIAITQSCAPATQTATSGAGTNQNARIGQDSSPEAQAQVKTQNMKETLSLTAEQVDKVLVINTVNLKTLKYLKDNNEISKIEAAQKTYLGELEKVLTKEQFDAYKLQSGN